MTNRLARYVGGGRVEIVAEPVPSLPSGGLLVRTEACGLCSGELMAWYMDKKLPHVLGHEVSGIVEASEDDRFPVGSRVFPHHHATAPLARREREVHAPDWRPNRLSPGGMAQRFAVAAEGLADCHLADDLDPRDAALAEPLACVVKSIRPWERLPESATVIGLGFMGLLHLHLLRHLGVPAIGTDLLPARREWAERSGFEVRESLEPAETVYVMPGSQGAFDAARVAAGGTAVLFAPLPPGADLRVPNGAYFSDLTIRHAYSAGPSDCADAMAFLRAGAVRAIDVVERFVSLDELPAAYVEMREAEIVKAMVLFPGDDGGSPHV
mgnify:CR=1 FL=1